MLTLGEIFNDCFYVQLLLSVHKLNDIIHIINGRDMKSYNQHYNEKIAYLRSKLPKKQYTSKQIQRLSKK